MGYPSDEEFNEARSQPFRPIPKDELRRYQSLEFVRGFNRLAYAVHETAKTKGWWDKDRNDGELIALMHSELSEALEGLRHNNPPDSHIPRHRSVEAELADVIIRIMDFAHARGHNVAEALVDKIEYNITREYKHGGKAF